MVNFVATTHPLGQKRCRRVLRLPECQFYRKGVGALLTPFCRLLKSEMAPDTNASWRDDGYAAHPIVLIIGSLSSESGFFDAKTGGSCRKRSCSTPDQLQNAGMFAGARKEKCVKGCRETRHPIQKMGTHRRGGRNAHPFRAKRDAGTKTCALIQGMCFWLMLGNVRSQSGIWGVPWNRAPFWRDMSTKWAQT